MAQTAFFKAILKLAIHEGLCIQIECWQIIVLNSVISHRKLNANLSKNRVQGHRDEAKIGF